MIPLTSVLTRTLNCECGAFESSQECIFQCINCGNVIPCFRNLDDFRTLPHWDNSNTRNPTPHNLIWGTEQQIDYSFHKRVSIVREMIISQADKCYIGADVAGGAGRWLPYLASLFDLFFHMDISREALKVACLSSNKTTDGKIVYLQNDMLATRQMVKNVDVAVCLDTLLYGGDFVDRALEGCSAILNDTGILIMELSSKHHNKFGKILKFKRKDAVERNFTIQAARNILSNHGFSVIKERYLFKEIPWNINRLVHKVQLPDSIINMSTWFYFAVKRTV